MTEKTICELDIIFNEDVAPDVKIISYSSEVVQK